jgi:hypothetical protein
VPGCAAPELALSDAARADEIVEEDGAELDGTKEEVYVEEGTDGEGHEAEGVSVAVATLSVSGLSREVTDKRGVGGGLWLAAGAALIRVTGENNRLLLARFAEPLPEPDVGAGPELPSICQLNGGTGDIFLPCGDGTIALGSNLFVTACCCAC